MFEEFISQLGTIKNAEIPFYFRNQFKIKENFINPNSKYFDGIVQKLIQEEKQGIKRKWDKQCKMMFIWVLSKYFQNKNQKTINPNKEEWLELSSILKTDETILKQRWITLINPVQKSINWDSQEDDIIRSLMNEQDEKHIWTFIALELYNKNGGQFIRTPKQVRERWMNYLNPKLNKANWTQKEDIQLLTNIVNHGKRWSQLSTLLQGRTENQVKNRFKSLMQKIYKDEDDEELDEIQAIQDYLKKLGVYSEELAGDPIIQKKQSFQIQKYKTRKPHIQVKHPKKTTRKKKLIKAHLKTLKQQSESINQEFIIQNNLINQKENNEYKSNVQVSSHPNEFQQLDQKQQVQQQTQISDINSTQTPSTLNNYFLPYNQQPYQLEFQQQNQNQLIYQSYRNQMEEFQQYQYKFMMEQYMKQFQSNYNAISPISMINQTPMTYTPTQQYQFYYNTFTSPQWNCSTNQDINSPKFQNFYWQNQQQNYDQFQNEQMRQIQYNHKLEFLNSNSLVDDWKRKRVNQKQNSEFQFMGSIDQ
ncbi:unnamed protein product [Paramecium pentaurelia]|uniref:Homeodomain protein n=1 Tax=Paramecium pentaurelia TaxID=43138 RepID=A0A8S1XA78_9CILI|nr:unnamed protein product [Paramecium pentaurelia]